MKTIKIDLHLSDFKTESDAKRWFNNQGLKIHFIENYGGAENYKMSGSYKNIVNYLSDYYELNKEEISDYLKGT